MPAQEFGISKREVQAWDKIFDRRSNIVAGFTQSGTCLHMASGTNVYGFDLRMLSMVQNESKASFKLGPLPDEINSICVNEKDEFLATSDDTGLVHVFDLRSKSMFKRLRPIHTNLCTAATFRPKRRWELWSGGMDNRIVKWDFSRGTSTGSFQTTQDVSSDSGKIVNPPFVLSLSFSIDGNSLFAGLGDGTIGAFELQNDRSLEITERVDAHSWSVSALFVMKEALSEDILGVAVEKPLISAGIDGNLHVWETKREKTHLRRVKTVVTEKKINAIAAVRMSGSLVIYMGGCPKVANSKNAGDIEVLSIGQTSGAASS
ncbi:WD40-repeat-containing domain protein [Chytridium lagenaria]|nr:WD40-repeat-containing domain protein [Chytridium lagenaria]